MMSILVHRWQKAKYSSANRNPKSIHKLVCMIFLLLVDCAGIGIKSSPSVTHHHAVEFSHSLYVQAEIYSSKSSALERDFVLRTSAIVLSNGRVD